MKLLLPKPWLTSSSFAQRRETGKLQLYIRGIRSPRISFATSHHVSTRSARGLLRRCGAEPAMTCIRLQTSRLRRSHKTRPNRSIYSTHSPHRLIDVEWKTLDWNLKTHLFALRLVRKCIVFLCFICMYCVCGCRDVLLDVW